MISTSAQLSFSLVLLLGMASLCHPPSCAAEGEVAGDFGPGYDAGSTNGPSSFRVFSRPRKEVENCIFFGAFITTNRELPKLAYCCILKNPKMDLDKNSFPFAATIDRHTLKIENTIESENWKFQLSYRAKFSRDGASLLGTDLLVGQKKINLDQGRIIEVELSETSIVFKQRSLERGDIDNPSDLASLIFSNEGK